MDPALDLALPSLGSEGDDEACEEDASLNILSNPSTLKNLSLTPPSHGNNIDINSFLSSTSNSHALHPKSASMDEFVEESPAFVPTDIEINITTNQNDADDSSPVEMSFNSNLRQFQSINSTQSLPHPTPVSTRVGCYIEIDNQDHEDGSIFADMDSSQYQSSQYQPLSSSSTAAAAAAEEEESFLGMKKKYQSSFSQFQERSIYDIGLEVLESKLRDAVIESGPVPLLFTLCNPHLRSMQEQLGPVGVCAPTSFSSRSSYPSHSSHASPQYNNHTYFDPQVPPPLTLPEEQVQHVLNQIFPSVVRGKQQYLDKIEHNSLTALTSVASSRDRIPLHQPTHRIGFVCNMKSSYLPSFPLSYESKYYQGEGQPPSTTASSYAAQGIRENGLRVEESLSLLAKNGLLPTNFTSPNDILEHLVVDSNDNFSATSWVHELYSPLCVLSPVSATPEQLLKVHSLPHIQRLLDLKRTLPMLDESEKRNHKEKLPPPALNKEDERLNEFLDESGSEDEKEHMSSDIDHLHNSSTFRIPPKSNSSSSKNRPKSNYSSLQNPIPPSSRPFSTPKTNPKPKEIYETVPLEDYTVELALTALGSLIKVSEAVVNGYFPHGIALTRPPGHHSSDGVIRVRLFV